ncbi:ADP-ribosylation/Crystallin J1 [Penicillium malachiteum]|uniref:ADP-ribosylation/Crystallin J1 n=1 Tax=Penicillium malachiteum TaxID=1324776 RepID=UPI002549ADEC|nr:ADP-ribosylation/Crystallin J1 [Penicillium malachiteum]KAJ5715589.1 ADP-ribosylation/Crystallin J1 [Penicillium malachiteum]
MTLALAQSMIDTDGYDHATSVGYFLDWLDTGRFSSADKSFDWGGTTRLSLRYWRTDIAKIGERKQLEKTQQTVRKIARRVAGVQSEVTHPMRSCMEACQLYTDLMTGVMLGESKEQLFERVKSFEFINPNPQLANRIRKYKTLQEWKATKPEDITSTGFVIDTLECVLWGFFRYNGFANGAIAVVNLAGDADSVGAIYGALAGAYYGVECIPSIWTSKMQKPDLIEQVANQFAEKVAANAFASS